MIITRERTESGLQTDSSKFTRLSCKNALMKSMTCNQLGGACALEFVAETFDEVAAASQLHGREMFAANDGPPMVAMQTMMERMSSGRMDTWMADRKAEFDAL